MVKMTIGRRAVKTVWAQVASMMTEIAAIPAVQHTEV
jgi:hypothetical protein